MAHTLVAVHSGRLRKGYPMERSFRSCNVFDVIGSQRPQYFKLVMLEDTEKKDRDTFDLPGFLKD